MANVAVTCIKNGRSDSFGRPLVSGTYYPSVEIETAKALWNSGYVSVADASVFDQDPLAGTSPIDDFNIARALSLSRQPTQTTANLAAELAALGIAGSATNGNAASYARAITDIVPQVANGLLHIKKTTANRFEVSVPDNENGRYIRHRFDNDAAQFVDASPSDTALGLTRPYQHTIVDSIFLGDATYGIAASTAATNGTPTASSSYLYLKNPGEYFEFTVTSAAQLRISILTASNGGTFAVTVDGLADLANLIPLVGGVALIDSYSTSSTGVSIMIADNLTPGQHLVRFTVVGKNPSSSDTRMYLENSAAYGLRVFPAWSNAAVAPIETSRFDYKIGGSAVNYAIAFRPSSMPNAASPFIGSVHGYENLTSLTLYCDGAKFDIQAVAINSFSTCTKQVVLEQKSNIYHPDNPGVVYASVTSTWTIGRGGISHAHKWTISTGISISNGYPDMFTVYGANQGSPGGPLLGWSDRVILGGHGKYSLVNGDSTQYGAKVTSEALFYGTPYSVDNPSRNPISDNLACIVSFPDVARDFNWFQNPSSAIDGIFIQDRTQFRKLYLQAFRGAGYMAPGSEFSGLLNARFVEAKGLAGRLGL